MTRQLDLFPPDVSPTTDWCLRWRDGRSHWRHRSEGGFDRRRYEVAEVSEATARAYVERHHYSGSYPAARLRYGLYEHDALQGGAVLSVPVQKGVLTSVFPELVAYYESLELGRFVLADAVAANGESWFLARVFERAHREGVRGVVSFSDPFPRHTLDGSLVFPGHLGVIYQASNLRYLGLTAPRELYLLPDGSVLNHRALSKVRNLERGHEYVERRLVEFGARPRCGAEPRVWLPAALKAAGVRRLRHPGCHRYAFPLERRVLIALAARAYPKHLPG